MRTGSLDEFSREELIERVLILERENAYLSKQATDMAVRLGEYEIKEEMNERRSKQASALRQRCD